MANNYHQSFSVFNALGDGFKIMKNEFSFFGVLVITYAILAAMPYIFMFNEISSPEEFLIYLEQGNFSFTLFYLFYLFYYLLYGIVIIITLDKTHATYNDIDFNNYPYVARAVKALFPIIGVYILSMILTFIGFIFLIIPGLVVLLTLYLAVPAKLAENIGIIDALIRSRELTKGNRWGILGTLLLPLIPIMIISFVIMSIMLMGIQDTGDLFSINPIYFIFNAAFGSLTAVYFIVVMGVIYQQIVAERKTLEDESF